MMQREGLRKADIVTSLVLILLGIAVLWAARDMPWLNEQAGVTRNWYLSPGLFPVVVGSLLILFSLNVLWRAIRDGGHVGFFSYAGRAIERTLRGARVYRVWLMWLLMGTYVFILFERFDYYVSTPLFLAVFMLLFHRRKDGKLGFKSLVAIAVVSTVVPVTVGYFFETYLFVPLP